jgi:hypothetical protein
LLRKQIAPAKNQRGDGSNPVLPWVASLHLFRVDLEDPTQIDCFFSGHGVGAGRMVGRQQSGLPPCGPRIHRFAFGSGPTSDERLPFRSFGRYRNHYLQIETAGIIIMVVIF